jgi:hypothetical protein
MIPTAIRELPIIVSHSIQFHTIVTSKRKVEKGLGQIAVAKTDDFPRR